MILLILRLMWLEIDYWKGILLDISQDALSYLAKEGYNPHYGARPLGRLIHGIKFLIQ